MKFKKIFSALVSAALFASAFAGCSSNTENAAESSADTSAAATAAAASAEKIVITGLADLTPHSEILEFVKPKLEEQGITIDIVGTASDATWNSKTQNGEVDFNFMQHEPYLIEWNELNGGNLVNVGAVHVEPIAAYSEKYTEVSQVPDNATVVVPNDATNEYRALRILEQAGFIKLNEVSNARASIQDIAEYIKPIEIVEMDSYQINSHRSEFDIYINNTNKVIEAGLDASKYLFRESSDSPYANIIVTTPDKADNPGIKALVAELQSPETAAFIQEKYNGAVIPVYGDNSAAESTAETTAAENVVITGLADLTPHSEILEFV
ncbi:MAG: MetQ/NlpA family ABC transporter substrate-binding protein, partial [Huintestinicola sp.]